MRRMNISVSYGRKMSDGNYGSHDVSMMQTAQLETGDDIEATATAMEQECREWVNTQMHSVMGTKPEGAEVDEFCPAGGPTEPKQSPLRDGATITAKDNGPPVKDRISEAQIKLFYVATKLCPNVIKDSMAALHKEKVMDLTKAEFHAIIDNTAIQTALNENRKGGN